MIAKKTPRKAEKIIEVLTATLILLKSPAPIAFEIITLEPVEKAIKLVTSKLTIGVVVPIEATATDPEKLPITAVSAAENKFCTNVAKNNGMAKPIIPINKFPVNIFLPIVFSFIIYTLMVAPLFYD